MEAMHFHRYVNEHCDGCGHQIRMGQRWTGGGHAYLYFDGAEKSLTNHLLESCSSCGHVFSAPRTIVSSLPTAPLQTAFGVGA